MLTNFRSLKQKIFFFICAAFPLCTSRGIFALGPRSLEATTQNSVYFNNQGKRDKNGFTLVIKYSSKEVTYFISVYNQLSKSSLTALLVYKGGREMYSFRALKRKNQVHMAIRSPPHCHISIELCMIKVQTEFERIIEKFKRT